MGLSIGSTSGRRIVEILWTLSLSLVVAQFAAEMLLSLFHGGLGLMIVDGEFVAGQGRARLPISQAVGLAWHRLDLSMLIVIPIALVLSLAVYVRQGALRPSKILILSNRPERLVLRCWHAAMFFAFAVWTAAFGRLLGVVFSR